LAKKKVLFHQDNAWVHMYPAPNSIPLRIASSSSIFVRDLAPCEFSKSEERFGGKRFITKEQFIAETYFEGLDKSYYSDGKKLENCWIKCIELKGDYVWEIKINRSKKCVLLCFSKNLLTCPHTLYFRLHASTLLILKTIKCSVEECDDLKRKRYGKSRARTRTVGTVRATKSLFWWSSVFSRWNISSGSKNLVVPSVCASLLDTDNSR